MTDTLATITPAQEQASLALQGTGLPGLLTLNDLKPDQLARAEQLALSLNVGDQLVISKVGAQLQDSVSQASEGLLAATRTSKSGEAGAELMKFMSEIEAIDVDSIGNVVTKLLSKVPMAKDLVDQIKGVINGLEPVVDKLDRAQIELKKRAIEMQEDVTKLNAMQDKLNIFIGEMKVVIAALKIRQKQEMEKLTQLQAQQMAGTGGDPMEMAELLENQQNIINLMDIRIGNLEQIRIIAIQAKMTAKAIQKGDMQLVVGLNDQVLTASTVWRIQIAASIALMRQQKGLEAYQAGVKATNAMVERTAEILGQQQVAIAQATNAGIVDMESLRKAQANIVKAITEVIAIDEQGRKDRAEREAELGKMEQNLANVFATAHFGELKAAS